MNIDPKTIYKGAFFSEAQIAEIAGIQPDDRELWKYRLKLRDRLEEEMEKKGEPATVRTMNGGLIILEDAIASSYGISVLHQGLRKSCRGYGIVMKVNPKVLTNTEKDSWLKNVDISSKYATAIAVASKQLTIEHKEKQPPKVKFSPRSTYIG